LSQCQEVVQDDVEALQEQIKEILTGVPQLQAITDMAINQQVLINLMQERDLDVAQAAQSFPGGGQPVNGQQQPEALGAPPANMTPGERLDRKGEPATEGL